MLKLEEQRRKQRRRMVMAVVALWTGAVLLCLVGALALAGTFGGQRLALWPSLIDNYLQDTIKAQVVVDSKDAPGYAGWERNYKTSGEMDSASLVQYFVLYNITNIDQVINEKALPIMEPTGPYYYWQKRTNFDVDFEEDGNKVRFNTWTRFYFLPDLSNGTEDEVIYNLNPAYMGALALSGGEWQLVLALTGPSLRNFFNFLWDTFVPDVVAQAVGDILEYAQEQLLFKTSMNQDQFLAQWANATSPDPKYQDLWKGMLVSECRGKASGISLESAKALFDPYEPNSLFDRSMNATTLWRMAIQGGLSDNNTAFIDLSDQFGLTDDQMGALISWFTCSFYPVRVYTNLTTLWNIPDVSDLAYMQWGEAIVAGGRSVMELYPDLPFPATPELASFWANKNKFFSLDWRASKTLLSGEYGLMEAQNVGLFFSSLMQRNFTYIASTWMLGIQDIVSFGGYFAYMAVEYGDKFATDIFSRGGGLITGRTVRQWLWEDTDPLLEVLKPELASSTVLVGNETSIEDARSRHKPHLCFTGKKDISQIGDYIEWRGQSELTGVYEEPLEVSGTNAQGQFQPSLDITDKLTVWDDHYMRPITLVPDGQVTIKGVKMLRYLIDNSTWELNPFYFQTIEGFANMSGAYSGAPVFLSNPHMYGADPKYAALVPSQGEVGEEDITVIDIEPNSGTITHYFEGLQLNLYIDPASNSLNLFNTEVKKDVMYPVMFTREYGELTKKDADLVRSVLYTSMTIRDSSIWISIGLATLFLLLALVSLWGALTCHRRLLQAFPSTATNHHIYFKGGNSRLDDDEDISSARATMPYHMVSSSADETI